MKKFIALGILYPVVFAHLIFIPKCFGEEVEEVLVSASPFPKNNENLNHPADSLSGENLHKAAASTLGETLADEVGVSSASFGPGVGLPIIRGQSDNRVKVMQDSVGSMDASAASPDHAISLEPLLAKRIEILRGPAALRYGSGAVGGVVNVIDNRIPDELPEKMQAGLELRANNNNRESALVTSITQPQENWAWHFDGLSRHNGDTQINGSAARDPALSDSNNKILNTSAETQAASVGASYFYGKDFIGASINHLDNNYGIPPSEDARVCIDLHQTRMDFKGEHYELFDFAEKLTWHMGAANYKHTELENGLAGTVFNNQAFEGRAELIDRPLQTAAGKFQWAQGVQVSRSDFSALGEEAFIPKSVSQSFGFFGLQDWTLGDFSADLGLRYQLDSIVPNSVALESKKYNALNFSAATSWQADEHQKFSLSLARSERAPSVEELMAEGPHPATGAFLIGDQNLVAETSKNIDLGYHWHNEKIELSLSVYRNQIDNYIYALDSGLMRDNLRQFNFTKADARFSGYEAEIQYQVSEFWSVHMMSDSVRALLVQNHQDIPRIPPQRVGFDLTYTQPKWNTQLKYLHASAQEHAGFNESTTPAYTRLDWYFNYTPTGETFDYLWFVKMTNLTNATIRNASSYLRDWAPETGRALHLGWRVQF